MTRPNLAEKSRTLVEAGRASDDPSAADRERVRARLTAALSAAGIFTSASKAAAAKRGVSTAARTAGTGIGAAKLFGSLATAAVLAAAAVGGVVWMRGTPSASRSTAHEEAFRARPRAMKAEETSNAREPASSALPRALDSVASPGLPPNQPLVAREPLGAAPVSYRKRSSSPRSTSARGRAALERTEPGAPAPAAASGPAALIDSDTPPSAAAVGAPAPPAQSARPATAERAPAPPAQSARPAAQGARPAAAERAPAPPTQSARPAAAAPAVNARSLTGELALLDAAQRALAKGELHSALAQLDQHAARFPNGSLVPERLAARAVTLCRMQRNREGELELRELQKRAPASPLLSWARASCASQATH
jgi:hypothetical protein